jgi:DNA-binding protein HU-beta
MRKSGSPGATDAAKSPAGRPIITLKHLAEWAGYNHGVPKNQAIEMFTGFVADIGRVLKKGSKIRIPNLGVLQVRIRPARKGRNPATGEEIRIKGQQGVKEGSIPSCKGFERSNLICLSGCSPVAVRAAELGDGWHPVRIGVDKLQTGVASLQELLDRY